MAASPLPFRMVRRRAQHVMQLIQAAVGQAARQAAVLSLAVIWASQA